MYQFIKTTNPQTTPLQHHIFMVVTPLHHASQHTRIVPRIVPYTAFSLYYRTAPYIAPYTAPY